MKMHVEHVECFTHVDGMLSMSGKFIWLLMLLMMLMLLILHSDVNSFMMQAGIILS